MSNKTLVAQLPPMTSADMKRFEKEAGIWGKQRSVRRQQVYVAAAGALAASAGGTFWAMYWRRNTILVGVMCIPGWALFGAVAGNYAGVALFPSVACNKETTMMRRVWWAKQCAGSWDMSQCHDDKWAADHPHSSLGKH
jgi:hypothetical protein